MDNIFFENWTKVWNVVLMTFISFIILFLFIRISGKRTLAKFNAFDFVVSVALGSTLAYMMLAMVPLVEGTLVLLIIIGLQYFFAKLVRLSGRMEDVINASPRMLFYKGQFLEDNMRKEVITMKELFSVIRQEGVSNLEDVLAIIIEANGELSVVKKSDYVDGVSSLSDLKQIKR